MGKGTFVYPGVLRQSELFGNLFSHNAFFVWFSNYVINNNVSLKGT